MRKLKVKRTEGLDHKIVIWGDYAIPLPLCADYLAFAANGSSWWYEKKPDVQGGLWMFADDSEWGKVSDAKANAVKPEPGRFEEQLYWIGD